MNAVSRANRLPPSSGPTAIVGLGASAGGLTALELFISHAPDGNGLAYIVVQHMDPTHKPLLSALLQRMTTMPVREATDAMQIERDSVYVIPPDCELTVARGQLHLAPTQQPRGRRLPINVLFGSLARDQGSRAIGVVLSGMGSDGTLGLQEIRKCGGMTLAQTPDSAQFDSMPRSAIDAGCVDIVAPPDALPGRIYQTLTEHAGATVALPAEEESDQHSAWEAILTLLRDHCKHDFSLYKPSSLRRRIERRVAVHGLESMTAYEHFLRENPKELDLLFAEVLIGVTSFFRNAEAWDELQQTALPKLIARRGDAAHMRAWVIGCSTGEEAYSLAMTFSELADRVPQSKRPTLQIFATDLNADAISFARKGLYPGRISAEIVPKRLACFFVPHDDGFLISKPIRDMVLFAQHDVIRDPPFTKLDILSCRNLLIYFAAVLQRRLMPLFHYSLQPGGIMLLGTSETAGRSPLFSSLSPKSRLYLRKDHEPAPGEVDFPVNRLVSAHKALQEAHVSNAFTQHPNLQTLAEHVLLQEHAPAAVLVNETGDIVFISGRTGKFLEPAAGKANWNIHVMARPGIRTQLAVALRQAVREKRTVELTGLGIDDDVAQALRLTVQFVRTPKALEGMVMIVFREIDTTASAVRNGSKEGEIFDDAVSQELLRSREEIHALRLEMQASRDELQALNEALQSANEELQSANEELTTSKEEAQSMNEELQTINGELQSKLDDLALAQNDMQNLLNSTEIATLFLDNDLNVRRFTEKAVSIFHLREPDVGRPLSDLASTMNYPDLNNDARETLRTLTPCTKQIATSDGRWLSIRIMPYRTLTNIIHGVVLTFVDITVTKELEFRLREGYSDS